VTSECAVICRTYRCSW